jgi:hypothetical protein
MQPSSGLCPAVSPHTPWVGGGLTTLRHDTLSASHCCPCATPLTMEVSCTPTSFYTSFSLHDSSRCPLFASLSHRLNQLLARCTTVLAVPSAVARQQPSAAQTRVPEG